MANFAINPDSFLPEFVGKDKRAKFSFTHPDKIELPSEQDLLCGVAEVDLTPPPGMPKAGYSSNAHDGNGFRTRIRARIFYLRHQKTSMAIVQCDLLGGSSVVQHLVAKAVEEATDIPLAGIMIGATHTHAAPGQFLGSDFYNRFASNHSGFDPLWTQFISNSIAKGVIKAYGNRTAAKIAIGTCEIWGLTRNRSLHPHVSNETVKDKRLEPQRKFHSINPKLHILRIDSIDKNNKTSPMGAAIIFSVHGTGISMRDHLYHSDVWAYICGQVKHLVSKNTGHEIVVGAMEGSHADVAPAIVPGQAGFKEAKRIGKSVGDEAYELYNSLENSLSDNVALGVAFRELNIDKTHTIGGVSIPDRPAVGAALVAGAKENTTPILNQVPPFRAGFPRPHREGDPQGSKWVIGTRWLQPIILPKSSFPRILPLQILKIGKYAIVGLPFEITVESGRRIAERAASELSSFGVDKAIVSSVANEYSGYVATKEEYELQYYEGGHTLYGPNTQQFLANAIEALANDLKSSPNGVLQDAADSRQFNLKVKEFMRQKGNLQAKRVALSPIRFFDPKATVEGYYELFYCDVDPDSLDWNERMVSIQSQDSDGNWKFAEKNGYKVDDQGWDIEITHQRIEADSHRYRVRWYDPAFKFGRKHRFYFHANRNQSEWWSDPFD
ncbi:MAG: hypothetical protein HKL80_00530 [Acidimicrobiales bacterium]|nr:hypothetical protein [Acidimicrobiales bacterium]